jgi:hypothetical protein
VNDAVSVMKPGPAALIAISTEAPSSGETRSRRAPPIFVVPSISLLGRAFPGISLTLGWTSDV